MISRRHAAFLVAYGVAVASAVVWLVLGLLPGMAAGSPALHSWLHSAGDERGAVAEIARNAAQAAHAALWGMQTFFDYLFSVFNLVVSFVLIRLRPHDRTARLLALGMVGSAVAFDLQGHDALQVVPVGTLAFVDAWHTALHVLSGVAYMFALLTFPDGHLPLRGRVTRLLRVPVIALLAWIFTVGAMITVDDHTAGLVVIYGILTPVAGVSAQVARIRRARDETERQQSTLLLWALGIAFLVAMPLMILTGSTVAGTSKTVAYEVVVPAPGTYYFRCDPHPDDMVGVVAVVPGGPRRVEVSSVRSRFDKEALRIGAGAAVEIEFTNYDTDLHNVAIYRDEEMSEPIFVGKEFSGRATAVTAFRIFRLVFVIIPIALIAALVRFRLWEMNRVVNRTLFYGLVIGFISAVYLAVVAGVGYTIGVTARGSVIGSIIATVLAAAMFQPLRDRARRLANRLVYGKRATPYELLSQFSTRLGGAYDLQQVIPQLANILGEGTGAAAAEVWLRVGDDLVLSAAWPERRGERPRIPVDDVDDVTIPGRDRVVRVVHGDEMLGALAIVKPPGEDVTPTEQRLLEDAASQAGLALKNAQLTAELQARLEELRRSRERIVTAQDAERRRLERDLHDGAQQHLVSLSMKLALAQDLSERDPPQARALMAELQEELGDALQSLRDLARGIHPPVLTDRGLAAALEAHARRAPVVVELDLGDVRRYDPHIEGAVYFCISEAIQNAIKHSGATKVTVALTERDETLTFAVRDEGRGFDPAAIPESGLSNIGDRVRALAGEVTIDSAPGRGTVIAGTIPIGGNAATRPRPATPSPAHRPDSAG